MAENLELIGLQIRTNQAVKATEDLKRRLTGLEKRFDRTRARAEQMSATFHRAGASLKAVLGGYIGLQAAIRTGTATLRAIAEHEQLSKRLDTLTGSAEAGAAAMKQLTRFAAETPFALGQSVNAFARFRSVGITPTIAQLRKLGDFAAAMGSDIETAAAAVVQGAFAETERLKSLAIASQVSASEIRLTYDDVTRAIQRTGDARQDAAAILDFVTELGASRFGDAMADQMQTIQGATSNLKDSLHLLAVEIGEGGLKDAWSQSVAGAAELTNQLREQLRIARETQDAEARTLALRSQTFQASRDAITRGNELERNLLRHLRASQDAEEKALHSILGTKPEEGTPPPPPVPVLEGTENQARLDELRAQVLELTHGREAADRYRVAVAGTSAELVEQELALHRASEALLEHGRAQEYAKAQEATRQARIEAALRSQERYVVALEQGRQAAERMNFQDLGPDEAQLVLWDQYAARIDAASTATEKFAGSGRILRDAMADAERRARQLESAVASLLRTAASGGDILARLAAVLQGHLVDQLAGDIAGRLSRSRFPPPDIIQPNPLPPDFGQLPVPTAPVAAGDTIHFRQEINVNTIDARGVADFLERNQDAIAGHAVAGIRRSSALQGALR